MAILTSACLACAEPPTLLRTRKVILIGIDGGDLTLLRELAAAGKLPHLKRLMEQGASGRLASIYAELPFSPKRGGGYWSPLVWTSLVTGREPEVHGVIDFRLPLPDAYRICTRPGSRAAAVAIPPHPRAREVRLQVDSDSLPGEWRVQFDSGGEPRSLSEKGRLNIRWEHETTPSDPVALQFSTDVENPPPLCLKSLDLLDSNQNLSAGVDFVRDRGRFGTGWEDPVVGQLRTVGPDYRRVRALWNIFSEAGHKVAVVGWRDSWPAESVTGYYISDRLGWRPVRTDLGPSRRPRLTYPAELTEQAQPLVDRLPEVDREADRTLLQTVGCELKKQARRVAHLQHSGDWLRHSLATELWDGDDEIRFLAVYYSGIDGFGHLFANHQGFQGKSCSEDPRLLERYYRIIDDYVGDWAQRRSAETALIIASDHGKVSGADRGQHLDTGFAILVGPGVREGTTIEDARVLDITPTILYLTGFPLASDMTGRPIWAALEPRIREKFPPRQIATYEATAPASEIAEPIQEDEAEMIERLRALGYIN